MNYKTIEIKLLYLFTCFLSLTLSFNTLSAKPKKNDLRPGMKLDDALSVTIRCVQEASGIKLRKKFPKTQPDPNPSAEEPNYIIESRIRPSDKLEFLGITDELRLDALRRYIVRNTEIGVQSIWGFHNTEKLAQHYIISNSSLAKLKKSSTVEEVARIISRNAGLPYLSYARAALIVSDCGDIKGKPESSGKVTSKINDTAKFVECIFTNEKKGIPGAGITAPSGDSYRYQIAASKRQKFERSINDGWSFKQLIENISEYATVTVSPELTATRLVVIAIANSLKPENKSFELDKRQYVKSRPNAPDDLSSEVSSFPISLLYRKVSFSEKTSLKNLNVKPAILKDEINRLIQDSERGVFLVRNKNRRLLQIIEFNFDEFNDITDETTVGEVIDIVTDLLNKQAQNKLGE